MKKKYGYKGFYVDSNGNIYCRNKYYKLGEVAEQAGELKLCDNGLHFCWNLANVMRFYNFYDTNVVIGKVEILGDVINDTEDQEIIKTMPNFDADIFEEITGVRV